jgi:ATP-dependent Clp endopeptidase proteolytic subunit ClpP
MKKNWYSITNKGDAECVIDIFDEIGMWGVSAKDFAEQLRGVGKIKSLTLNLDSPGGDCNDGLTIYDAIKASGASVTVNVIGLAASMASVIMLAADAGKIRIYENARVMIHRVTGGAHGNTDDLAAAAQLTKQFEDRIVALYVARTGKDEADIRDMMKAQLGTWFFGQEAVDAGFADSVISGVKAKAFKAQWAGLFTMLPAALFKDGEKAIDTAAQSVITAQMEPSTPTPVVAEPVAPVVTPLATPTPAPVEAPPDVPAISAKAAADAITAERARITEIKAWAKSVEAVQKVSLTDAVDTFTANGKNLAEFKEHVILNTFKAATVATSTDAQGAAGNTMKRADFDKLSPFNKADFCKKGGKITD